MLCHAVDKRGEEFQLLAILQGGGWLCPSIQFHDGEVILGLTNVLDCLREMGRWMTLTFLVTPDSVVQGL